MDGPKPPGWQAFQRAVRSIVKAPKAEVDAALKADKKARMKMNRKRKSD